MTWHWTGLAVFSLTLLPAGLALLTGRMPHRQAGKGLEEVSAVMVCCLDPSSSA
ncbi:hypothetical protein OHB05_29570 [Streptomyces sp. NBC_00638]|uniref:hypothetical protein n=1 Tax=Streptomyces sp. NBC_00638 TaxID=2975794 RepID=UPI0022529458|nr:hypothetical protein [Streptomyces sp. NBC_00638]MCX5006738.1 hypothetical protein [Streptomyces sp. NBC_00638]